MYIDPINQNYPQPNIPDMRELKPEDRDAIHVTAALFGCAVYVAALIVALVICVLFGSCTTHREVTSVEQHSIHDLMQRMDSVISTRQVIRQDSSWRELIMSQFQSIREHNDTSHTLVVDSAGRVISERIIIRTERESTSETDRREREVLIHRLEVMDSTLTVMQQQFNHIDSLMQSKQTSIKQYTKSSLTVWQRARLWLANVVLVALILAAAVWALRRRAWWLRLFRK